MNTIVGIFSAVTIGLIGALAKAYIDIQVMKCDICELQKQRDDHERKNDEQYTRLYDKLDEIKSLLINEHNKK